MEWWDEFLDEQEKRIGKPTVDKWLRSIEVIRFAKTTLQLSVADPFHKLWFEEHARAPLIQHLQKWGHKKLRIQLTTTGSIEKKKKIPRKKENVSSPAPDLPSFSLTFEDLDPLLTRENFHVFPALEVPCKIIDEMIGYVAETEEYRPNQTCFGYYNPLYLYGKKGCGKTHLLTAIAHAAEIAGLKPLYIQAEMFIDHVVAAIRAGEMSQFRQAYRNVDILLIDDIDLFSRKGSTQEELFHTFNTLHLNGKQIVLSAHCAPQELEKIEPRLISRFAWGMVLALPLPDKKERTMLVKAKLKVFEFSLPSRLIDLLIDLFPSSPKRLIHAVEALFLRTKQRQLPSPQALLQQDVKKLLSDLIEEEQKKALTPEQIIRSVSEYFGIRYDDVLGKAQTKECVLPRQLAMHLCRSHLSLPYMKIGEIFSRDHSTVMTSVQTIEKKILNKDRGIHHAYGKITHRLAG